MDAVVTVQGAYSTGVQQVCFGSEGQAVSAMRTLQEQMQGEGVRAAVETDDDVINLVAELRREKCEMNR